MTIKEEISRVLPCPILNRHLLFGLLAASIAAWPAGAQEENLGLNPDAVPTNTVIATVPLGGSPGYMVLNPNDNFLYVATYISSSSSYVISQIDTTTHVVTTFPLTGTPSGLAVTPNGKQLYVALNVGLAGAVAILDASTGTLINTVDLTGGPNLPQISPDGKYAYVPIAVEGGSDVTVIDTAAQKITKAIPITTFPAAVSVVFNVSGSIAYVTGFNLFTGLGSVGEIDTATQKLTYTVPVDAFTISSIVNPITNEVWTVGSVGDAGGGFNAINVIKGHQVIETFTTPGGVACGYPAFTPNGKYAYMPEAYLNGSPYNYVYLTDTKTCLPVGTPIQVGNEPYFVRIAHSGKSAYVANQVDETVSVIQISPAQ
jgi:DNA-binding beta-propeller fold protein YncE